MNAFSVKTMTLLVLCGISHGQELTCADQYPECPAWEQAGECESNKDSMDTNCPLSCGVCSTSCHDNFAACPTWKEEGEFEKNPEGMNSYCALSCGACSIDKCHDLYADCPTWQQDGECEKNPQGMSSYCAKTCGTCDQFLNQKVTQDQEQAPPTQDQESTSTSTCVDQYPDCPLWQQNGECDKNPEGMHSYCMKSCGTCASACVDQYPECPEWSKNGECQNNPEGMKSYCMLSCEMCVTGLGTPVKSSPSSRRSSGQSQKRRPAAANVSGKGKGKGNRHAFNPLQSKGGALTQEQRQERHQKHAQAKARERQAVHRREQAEGKRAPPRKMREAESAFAFTIDFEQDAVKIGAGVLVVAVLGYLVYSKRPWLFTKVRKGGAMELSTVTIPGMEVPKQVEEVDDKLL